MAIDDYWFKNAVIYCLNVATYMDCNGDGTGDFEGLSRRLDYLHALGVTCVWLQPFYCSPNRDNGYDVSDFYGVSPRLGTSGDFVECMNHAHALGMRVVVERQAPAQPRQGDGVPADAGHHVDARQEGRQVLLPPLLRAPARPQHASSGLPRGAVQDHGLLAAARRLGLPHGRRAVPRRAQGRGRQAGEGLRAARGDAALPAVACARRHPPRRGERAAEGKPALLRRRGRPAADDAQLPGEPAAVLRVRHRRREAAAARDPGDAG